MRRRATPRRDGGATCRRAALRVLAASALALAACATYQPAPIDPAASAERFSARRLDAPELRERIAALQPDLASPWPPAAWNRAQLFVAALALNPKLAVASAQARAAQAHEITAAERPNPELTLQSEYARREPHPWLYGVSLDLLLGSQRRTLERESARIETAVAHHELMEQVWTLRRTLVAALSEREGARRRAQLLATLDESQRRLVAIERRRLDAGEQAADVLYAATRAQVEIEQQAAQAQAELGRAEAALAAALGVAPAALDGVTVDWPDWGEPAAVGDDALRAAREQALRSRADLAGAIAGYAAAENRLQLAVVQQYPQVHLSPGYYWDHGIGKFPLNAAFELPLFNRHAGEIAEARAARDVAGERMLAVQADIVGAIDAAERAERRARDAVAAGTRALEAAREQRRAAASALRLGAIAASEDLDAGLVQQRTELELLALRSQWQDARDALEDALHAPLTGPELLLAAPLPALISAGAER